MAYIAKGFILHNGNEYAVGDTVLGLTEREARRLVDLDVIEGEVSLEESAGPINAAAFATLGADKQKERLHLLGIDPESNKEQRQAQYEAWLLVNPGGDAE